MSDPKPEHTTGGSKWDGAQRDDEAEREQAVQDTDRMVRREKCPSPLQTIESNTLARVSGNTNTRNPMQIDDGTKPAVK